MTRRARASKSTEDAPVQISGVARAIFLRTEYPDEAMDRVVMQCVAAIAREHKRAWVDRSDPTIVRVGMEKGGS